MVIRCLDAALFSLRSRVVMHESVPVGRAGVLMRARIRCSAACVVETDRRRSEKNGNAGMYVTHVRTVVDVIYAMWVTYVMYVCHLMHAL